MGFFEGIPNIVGGFNYFFFRSSISILEINVLPHLNCRIYVFVCLPVGEKPVRNNCNLKAFSSIQVFKTSGSGT